MKSDVFAPLMVLLIIMAAIWLPFVVWLFRYLRKRHPSTYQAVGEPSLFWNNSMRTQWLFFKFTWSSKPRELGDLVLLNAIRFTRVFLISYLLLFSVIMTAFLTKAFTARAERRATGSGEVRTDKSYEGHTTPPR
jgi:hypothetical protein